jgi:hypothetical protein
MKKEFKIDLSWKQKIITMIVTSVLYGVVLYLFDPEDNIKGIVFQAVFFGVLFVFLFPWLMKKIVGKRLDDIAPELLENEKIEEEIFANLFRGLEGVGGKIFLTNQRLIFKSHSLNVQKGQTNIDYSEIVSVQKRKTIRVIKNGIKIITKHGKEYRFVIKERDIHLQKINNKLI